MKADSERTHTHTHTHILAQEPVAGSCKHGNEPSCPIKQGEYLD